MTAKTKDPMPVHRVLIGDCREQMATLPAGSVHCCVTSPPYWALRSYLPDEHPDKHLERGLEKTPDEYIASMVAVFREVKRVLRDDGCLWVNIGDSYNAGTSAPSKPSKTADVGGWTTRSGESAGALRVDAAGLKPKDLVGIPWRLAFALQADGWYLRQDIIWSKPAPMPESVRDRCTKSHEYIFLLTKRPRYFWDAEAVKETLSSKPHAPGNKAGRGGGHLRNDFGTSAMSRVWGASGRNRRSVWTINTEPFRGAHFATFPTKLVEPCILAGTSAAGCCAECGKPWERVVDIERWSAREKKRGSARGWQGLPGRNTELGQNGLHNTNGQSSGTIVKTTGWRPACTCNAPAVPCTVLDPFGGSGTTAGVALYHRRNAILCELNPEYAAMVPGRIDDVILRMRKREAKRAAKKQAKPLANQKTLWSDE